jgi:hypothetical protein
MTTFLRFRYHEDEAQELGWLYLDAEPGVVVVHHVHNHPEYEPRALVLTTRKARLHRLRQLKTERYDVETDWERAVPLLYVPDLSAAYSAAVWEARKRGAVNPSEGLWRASCDLMNLWRFDGRDRPSTVSDLQALVA